MEPIGGASNYFAASESLTQSVAGGVGRVTSPIVRFFQNLISGTSIPSGPDEITVRGPAQVFELSLGRMLLLVLTLFLIIGVIYVMWRTKELQSDDRKRLNKYFIRPTVEDRTNERWQEVERLFQSNNPNDWRTAIIEADVMLEDLTLRLGYKGETLGERLKSIEPSDFPLLQYAWEAHKIRNNIAHQGMNYPLDRNNSWRAFKLFEAVFKDAQYI